MRVTEVDQKQEDKHCMTSPTSLDLRDESKIVFIIDEGRSDGGGTGQQTVNHRKAEMSFCILLHSRVPRDSEMFCSLFYATRNEPKHCYHVEPMIEKI